MLRPSGLVAIVLLILGSCGGGLSEKGSPKEHAIALAMEAPTTTTTPTARGVSGPKVQSSTGTDSCTGISSTGEWECKCKTGDMESCLRAADALFRSREHDSAIIQTYTLCKIKGVPKACFQAAHYMTKLGIQRRLGTSASMLREQGITLLKEGCAADDARACFGYGKILLKGRIVAVDVSAGEQHLSSACRAGHAPACSFLANIYETGAEGIKKDMNRALTFLETACQSSQYSSCTILGNRIASRDRDQAKSLYQKACTGDDADGCVQLALVWTNLGEDENAHATFLKACELEHSASCVDAGALAEAGKGTSKDVARARELYQQACEEDDGRDCFSLASLVAKGLGGPRNWGRAVELHQKSCTMEFKAGCKAATKLNRNPPDWRCTTEPKCARN